MIEFNNKKWKIVEKMVMPNGLSYEKIKEDVKKNLSNYKIDKSFYNLELQNANDMQLETWRIINSEIKKYAAAEGSYGTTIWKNEIEIDTKLGNVKIMAGEDSKCFGADNDIFICNKVLTERTQKGNEFIRYIFEESKEAMEELLTEIEECQGDGKIDLVARIGKADNEEFLDWTESYRPGLKALKAKHPNWVFERLDANNTWQEFIDIQDKEETNLLRYIKSIPINWFEKTSSNEVGWGVPIRSLIEYYVDPRNFIDEKNIFQFEKITPFSQEFHTLIGLENLLKNHFLIKYKESFFQAGKEADCSPYFLAEKSMLEMGKGNDLTNGTVKDYKDFYNFYNIGAYVTKKKNGEKTSANTNGAIYAKKQEWNTPEKAIIGGGKWINNKYFSSGQTTQYLFKFNALNKGNNQFVQNVMAGVHEVSKRFDTYSAMGVIDKKITFLIPVYKEMPKEKCPKPN